MPRPKRFYQDGLAYHVVNRGNRRARVFLEPQDYQDFLASMAYAAARTPMRVLTFCLMTNHWHLVLWPHVARDLSAYMQLLMNCHIRKYQRRHGTAGTGHIYQGRFYSVPIVGEYQFLKVCRYVEANPVRAGLVNLAEDYRWSGLADYTTLDGTQLLSPWPVPKPSDWIEIVNRQLGEDALRPIRKALERRQRRRKEPPPENPAGPDPV